MDLRCRFWYACQVFAAVLPLNAFCFKAWLIQKRPARGVSFCRFSLVLLVPKLQLGNAVLEAPASLVEASWNLGTSAKHRVHERHEKHEQKQDSFVLFVFFVDVSFGGFITGNHLTDGSSNGVGN